MTAEIGVNVFKISEQETLSQKVMDSKP